MFCRVEYVNQAKLAAKRAEIASRHKIYKKRLRDIYINGQVNYLDVLLGAKDFSDFSSRMYLLQSIVKSDLALIDEIQAAAAEISERQKVLDSEMREMKASQAALDSKKARITAYRRSISRRIARAEQVQTASNAEIDRLEASSNAVTEMLRNLESSGGSSASQGQGASGSYGPVVARLPLTLAGVPILFLALLNIILVWILPWIPARPFMLLIVVL